MKSIILALAIILMPTMAFAQQRHVRVHINAGVHKVHPHVRVHPHVHRHRYVRPYIVYPPLYVHPTPYTLPYCGGYNYYPYGSYFYHYNGGTGVFLRVR